MANLKGGNFEKQIKDAFHRLEAFGVGRVGKNDNLTHSDKLAEKREMYLKDITSFFKSQNLNDKLNTLFTKQNLDNFFNKSTFEALTELIQETADDIQYLESISNALDIALSEADLAQIKEELMQSGYIRRKHTKKKVKLTSKPMHYISSDGYDMYVGKNNLQNEELTFSFANGNDWWFHAKGAPGSHVIVKSGGDELPDRTFEEAGRLAAYYSKNRGADKVEIDYIQKKHVKKPNGAKPGFVVYYTNYSLVIDSDISNIKNVQD